MLVAHRALAPLLDDLEAAAAAAARLAAEHRGTLLAGRTLLQQAVPVTLGLKAAGWLTGLDDAIARLRTVRDERLAVQLGGAAGTLASLGDRGADVMDGHGARRSGSPQPVLPWHTIRTRPAELAGALGTACGVVAKIARDVALMAQTEVAEVAEGAAGGSSTMPHKRNPVAAVSAAACAAQAPGLVATLLGAMAHEHERAAGSWHAEWRPFTELLRSTGSAAAWLRTCLEELEVDARAMRENLDITGGLLLAERVSTELAPELGRMQAHEAVQRRRGRRRPVRRGAAPSSRRSATGSPRSGSRSCSTPRATSARRTSSSTGPSRPTTHGRPTLDTGGPAPRHRRPGRRAGGRPVPLARLDARALGAPGRGARGALPRGPRRPARARRVAGPAGAVHDRRASAATSSRCSTASASSARTSSACRSAGWSPCGWRSTTRIASGGSCPLRRRPRCRTPGSRRAAAAVREGGTAAVADAVLDRWLTPEARDADPARAARMRSWVLDTPDEGYAASCEAIDAMDLLGGLPGITAPTLVISGLRDPAIPPEHQVRIAAGIPGARLGGGRRRAHPERRAARAGHRADPRAPARPTTPTPTA